uniref:Putative secreted protein n=1 Tax=Rhipicephalus microplus TaxID=6941 RepID=A0A6G5A419_RHIMP
MFIAVISVNAINMFTVYVYFFLYYGYCHSLINLKKWCTLRRCLHTHTHSKSPKSNAPGYKFQKQQVVFLQLARPMQHLSFYCCATICNNSC